MSGPQATDGHAEDAPSEDHEGAPGTTQHFEARRRQGDRPTGQALADARTVQSSNLFIDDVTGLFVVQGPRGRAHIFLRDGLCHTSFHNTRANTLRRVRAGRWCLETSEECKQFQLLIQSG